VVTQGLLPRRGHRIRAIQELAAAYRELSDSVRMEGQTTLAEELMRKADWAAGLAAEQPDLPDE
jgi:hypothetical protein